MRGRRLRRATRLVLVAVLLFAGTMVWAGDSGPQDAADRPWARRPLPNLLTPVWTSTVANLDVPGYRGDFISRPVASFSPEAAVLPGLTNIEIRDPRTGRMLHDVPVGERVGDVAIAGGVAVAQTRRSDDGLSFHRLRAYDISSGSELWSQSMYSSQIVETSRYSSLGSTAVTSRGVVFTAVSGELIGLDLKTGAMRWTKPAVCSKGTLSATERMVALVCEKGPLFMVDAEAGRLYSAKIPGTFTDVATTSDAIGIEWTTAGPDAAERPGPVPQTTMVVSESGFVLGRIDGAPGRLVQVLGGQAVLEEDGELRAVSLGRGTELWRRKEEVRADYGGTTAGFEVGASTADGLVLLNGALEGDRPGTTTLVDPSGRTTPPLPWPLYGQFAGAIPGYVFLVSHGFQQYQFTALRLERKRPPVPRLGTARLSDWPDPCRLLSTEQLATLGGGRTGFRTKGSPYGEFLRLPYADKCNFTGRHPFSLQVAWVAPDEAAAEALVQSLLPRPYDVWQAGPGGYRYVSPSFRPGPVGDRALVVRGRFVIGVFAPARVDLAEKIARLLQADRPPAPAGAFDRAAAEKTVRDHGFTAVIQMSPPNPGPLRAVYAHCGSECGQVFLFEGNRLVGAPPGESAGRAYYWDVQIVRQDGRDVRLAAFAAPPSGVCCRVPHDLIDLRMSDGRLMYRVEPGPWRPAPATPSRVRR